MVKIIMTVKDGVITSICTNQQEAQIVIVDFDLQDYGVHPVNDILEQDGKFEDGKAYLLFDEDGASDQEVFDELKRIKY